MQTLYSEFLNEYELLQHMEEVKEDSDVENRYYLPHRGVLRLSSKTTRLRVVFNASAKMSSGLSLNDLLCKGGVIQEDLFSILIIFRKYAYAFAADIRQMFRMIEVNPSQTKLQKILWKNNEKKDFPLASEVLLQDFYRDDCLPGASELSEFEKLKSELTQLLQRGGMTLHKWCSNKATSTELQEFLLDRCSEEVMVKTLGMLWDSPGPVIAKAKIFMQQLWLLKLDCNETLPPDVPTQWRNFIQTLKDIESIHVPRCFLVVPFTKSVVLNGFADASSKAYGAVIYVQTNETTNQLLCSKSRLAPIKSTTILRLELCLLPTSRKTYLQERVVGSARLTLEEYLTVITQIEGILNSRPLSPLPTDTDDFQVLTPGHFLIGKPINSLPEPNLTERRNNLLIRWQEFKKWCRPYGNCGKTAI
ncbi:integrase catalytic domain-containing protein [Trichonephila clavipes]|nr:integrase catalytic domain-containing protein [Trichonephila clavipes]